MRVEPLLAFLAVASVPVSAQMGVRLNNSTNSEFVELLSLTPTGLGALPAPAVPRSAPADTSFVSKPLPTPRELACLLQVREAFDKIWLRAGNGSRKEEAAFRIDWIDEKIEIVMAPWTWGDHTTRVPVTTRTIAIAHTHPNDSSRLPSDPGDYSYLPNFVVTAWHLYLADPVTRKPVLITKNRRAPCPAAP